MAKAPDIFSELTQAQQALILEHLSLVLESNQKINLTRISDSDQAKLLHIEDSLIGMDSLNSAPKGLYADLGTGAGYPGIPLAIATGRKTTLVESVKKKAAFLDQVITALDLEERVTVFDKRAEELALEHPQEYSVLSARALSSLPSLLELGSPLLKMGGRMLCYKSDYIEDELIAAKKIEERLGLVLVDDEFHTLSDGLTTRRLLVFEKASEPRVALPRRPGMAQKRPYSS